jgi:hypothetical protein
MIQRIKKLITNAAIFGLLFAPALAPAAAYAQIDEGLNEGICKTDPDECATSPDAEGKINSIVKTVIDLFSLIVGIVSVIMIIVGGLKYITSGGDSGNVTGAKNTILYAVIGLVVVALAQFIVRFVLSKVNP